MARGGSVKRTIEECRYNPDDGFAVAIYVALHLDDLALARIYDHKTCEPEALM